MRIFLAHGAAKESEQFFALINGERQHTLEPACFLGRSSFQAELRLHLESQSSMPKRAIQFERITIALACAFVWPQAYGQSAADVSFASALQNALRHPPPLPKIDATVKQKDKRPAPQPETAVAPRKLSNRTRDFTQDALKPTPAPSMGKTVERLPPQPLPTREQGEAPSSAHAEKGRMGAAAADERSAPPGAASAAARSLGPVHPAVHPAVHPVSLRDALGRAATRSIQVVLEFQKVLTANAELKASAAPFLPQLSLSAQAQKYGNLTGQPGTTLVGSTLISSMGSVYTNYVSLMGSYNLYDGGQDQASREAAQDAVRAQRESLDDTRNRAVLDTLFAYTTLRDAQTRVEAQREIAELTRHSLALVRARYKRGAASLIQVNQASSDLSRAELALADAQETLRKRSADLAQLIALPLAPGETLAASDEAPVLQAAQAGPPAADLADRMPTVRAAIAELAQARAIQRKARGAYRPQVNLTASYNWLGSTGQSSATEILGHSRANNYTVGLSISQTLFPFVAQSAAVDKAGAAVMTAEARLTDARVAAAAKLARAEAELERGGEAAALAQEAVQQAQGNLVLTQALFAKGRASRSDLDQMRAARIRAGVEADAAQQQLRSAQWAMYGLTHPADLLASLRVPVEPHVTEGDE